MFKFFGELVHAHVETITVHRTRVRLWRPWSNHQGAQDNIVHIYASLGPLSHQVTNIEEHLIYVIWPSEKVYYKYTLKVICKYSQLSDVLGKI